MSPAAHLLHRVADLVTPDNFHEVFCLIVGAGPVEERIAALAQLRAYLKVYVVTDWAEAPCRTADEVRAALRGAASAYGLTAVKESHEPS